MIVRWVMAVSDVPLIHKLDVRVGVTVDGLRLQPGWQVLAVAEPRGRHNGMYALDDDGITLRRERFQWHEEDCVQVAMGTCYYRTWWTMVTPEPVIDRVTPLVFVQTLENAAKGIES